MVMRRLALILAAGTAALLPATSAASQPSATTPSLLGGFSAMAIDAANRHVFLTGYVGQDSALYVFDYRGGLVTVMNEEPGASGLVLDGDRLYVALWAANAISTIDTTTLTEVARTPLAPGLDCPNTMTQSGTRLWFGFTCDFDSGGVGYLDLSTGRSGFLEPNGAFYDPLVASAGDILVTSDRGLSPVTLYEYDVSGTPRLLRSESNPGPLGTSDLVDLDMSGDGTDLLVTASTPSDFVQSFALSDLQLDATYGDGDSPYAVNVAPDGTMVIAAHQIYDPALFFYLPGSTEAYFTEVVDSFGFNRSVGLSPDLLWVFQVRNGQGQSKFLVELGPANSFLDLTPDRDHPPLGRPVNFEGTLTFPLGPSPESRTIQLRRRNPDGSKTSLGSVLTGSHGAFGFTDTPPTTGNFIYTAIFPGDDGQPKAVAGAKVQVH